MDLFGKFKEAERKLDFTVEPKSIYAIRVDGRSFKQYTKGFDRPFDKKFMTAMDKAALLLCNEISGALFAYVQSDEITIFFSDLQNENSQLWFGGRLNKWVSAAASLASVSLARSFPEKGIPTFDARVLKIDDMQMVEHYLDWRTRDAYKNSITMAASCHRSHGELMSKTTKDRIVILEGTEHAEDKLPLGFRYGRIVTRKKTKGAVEIPATKTREAATIIHDRYEWVFTPATVDVVLIVLGRMRASLSALVEEPS